MNRAATVNARPLCVCVWLPLSRDRGMKSPKPLKALGALSTGHFVAGPAVDRRSGLPVTNLCLMLAGC